ncbi:FecR family protein [Brucellaceae bacterium D45D]
MVARDLETIDEEAVQWFVLLQDEAASDEDRQRFELWRLANSRHDHAWREVERLWGNLDQLSVKYALVRASSASLDANRQTRRSQSRRPFSVWKALPIAASIAIAAIIAWQMMPAGLRADYRSAVGERQLIRLTDSSEIELGTGSAIDVDFSQTERTVRLVAGEAFFSVAKDSSRPFVVKAEQGQVKVLGTAFNMKIEHGVTVTVTHNTVAVNAASGSGVRVKEGETVHYDEHGLSAIRVADLDKVQAWRQDQLVFRDAPLNDVLAELQRYRHGRIQLLSGEAGNRRVTAVFDARHTDAALDTIAQNLGLRVYRATNLLVGIVSQ